MRETGGRRGDSPDDAVGPFANDIKDLVVATDDEVGHAVVHGGGGVEREDGAEERRGQ